MSATNATKLDVTVRAAKTFVAQCTRYLNICPLLLNCHTKTFVGMNARHYTSGNCYVCECN